MLGCYAGALQLLGPDMGTRWDQAAVAAGIQPSVARGSEGSWASACLRRGNERADADTCAVGTTEAVDQELSLASSAAPPFASMQVDHQPLPYSFKGGAVHVVPGPHEMVGKGLSVLEVPGVEFPPRLAAKNSAED